MKKLNKVAAEDAYRWARAEMFFGEGAGTRRKLLQAEISHKVENVSGYHEAFEKALGKQDMAEHAIKAAKERRRIDGATFVSRNLRGLATGNRQSLTTGVAVVVGTYAILHQTGLDEPLIREGKKQYQKGKKFVQDKRTLHKAKWNLRAV